MHHKIEIHRKLIMYLLMSDMNITLDEVDQLVYELENSGLIQFDQAGKLRILDLEGNHETHYRKSLSNVRALL